MKEKECKYFMAGTDEEVFLGDVIETEVVKEFKDGRKITRELEFKLTEDTLPLALEMNIIECEEEEDELVDFGEKDKCEDCIMNNLLNELCVDQEKLEKRVNTLEDSLTKIWDILDRVNSKSAKLDKTASPKKTK